MITHVATAASSSSSADELTTAIVSLFWIACVVAVSPLVVRLARGLVPDVVVLLVLGCAIGASGLDLASTGDGVELIRELGLGLLFLMAGSEIDPATLRSQQGRHAAVTWLLCLVLGFALAWAFIPDADFQVALVLAIAITSTALGAILPILQDRGLGGTALGRAVLTHGAMGELGPILVMAVLLGSRSTLSTLALLILFVIIAIAVTVVPRALVLRVPGLRVALMDGMHGTGQTGMRVIFLLLLTLMAAAAVFELDVVLGAFAAGFILRELQPADAHFLEERVQIVAWSLPVPVFFVTSGMSIDIDAVMERPGLVVTFVAMIILVRGGVVWLRERFGVTGSGLTTRAERYQLALYSAAGLPIIVAVTELARERDLMPEDVAATLVAAGAVTLLLFPLLARFGGRRRERLATRS
ncbi:cation:proton antiporter [Nocardioides sambongensis]|uniref:cation:proton antiporter n=1 Tax=Nocardioides sambongensis TaxID=2589074 RepID=UPI001E5017FD|nr:cation:proton antiporter [Nocardioides sambongensis]